MGSNDSQLLKFFSRRDELQASLGEAVAERGGAQRRLIAARSEAIQAREHIGALEGTVRRDEDRGVSPSPSRAQLTRRREELAQLSREIADLEATVSRQDQRMGEIRAELDAPGGGAAVEDALAHKRQIAKVTASIGRHQTAIEEQETALSELSDDQDARLEELQAQREQLLAGISLGKPLQAALEKCDAKLNDLLSDADGAHAEAIKTYRHATQTLTGLRRSLRQEEEELDRLNALTPKITAQVIVRQAHDAYREYLTHAAAAAEAFKRLYALGCLHGRLEGQPGRKRPAFVSDAWGHMLLPTFELPARVDVRPQDEATGVLFSATAAHGGPGGWEDMQKQIRIEAEWLEAAGLDVGIS